MAEVEFTWALDGYCARYGFLAQPEGLTMREAARVFQLDPQPPEAGTLNDYITAALRERNLDYFSFFLHHYETRLNGRVRRFLMREGLERYDPERFLDYKMGCVLAMLDCLPGYDPMKEADFWSAAARKRPVPSNLWTNTRPLVGSPGSTTIPARAQKMSSPNMPTIRTAPK